MQVQRVTKVTKGGSNMSFRATVVVGDGKGKVTRADGNVEISRFNEAADRQVGRGATFAAKKYFDFKTVIPCHYRSFPLLEQSAQEMIDGLPGVNVIEPQVLEAITL